MTRKPRSIPFFVLAVLLVAGACTPPPSDPAVRREPGPVMGYDSLTQGRVLIPSVLQSYAGLRLDQLGPVLYRPGDDPAWKDVDHDDSDWRVLRNAADVPYRCGEVHWFRVHYSVDSTLAGVPLHMNIFAPGAVEVYLNGRYLHHYGVIEQRPDGLHVVMPPTAPRRQIRFAFPADRLRDGVLAFRYAVCPLIESKVELTPLENPAPLVLLTPLDQADPIRIHEDQTLQFFGLFVGCAFLIALLTMVLYLYNRREVSWLFIALSAGCTCLVAFTHLGRKGMLGVPYGALQIGAIVNSAAYPLSFFFLVLAMKSLFDRLERRTWLPFLLLTCVALFFRVGGYFIVPHIPVLDLALIAVMFVELARLSIRGLRQRAYGRWILGSGVIVFFFFGVVLDHYYIFTQHEMPWTLRTIMRFAYYLSVPTTITIFLAVKSAENGRLAARRRDELDAEVRRRTAELEREKEKSEQLLLNILPHQVARELKESGRSEAREFDLVTVLFADFIDFTQQASALPAKELLEELNYCFRAFDEIAEKYCVEKIKTIGDAYMAAGGLGIPCTIEPADVVLAALEMQQFMCARRRERAAAGLPSFEMRVGIHSGPVVAGIVGVKKFQYDIWGDTVNIASRMESAGAVGRVNISQATYELIRHDPRFTFRERGLCAVKGKGEMMMYFVEGKA